MLKLIQDIKTVLSWISRREKYKFTLLLILMLIGSLFEAIGIGIIPAYILVLTEPAKLQDFPLVGQSLAALFSDPDRALIVYASFFLIFLILLKNVFLTGVHYTQLRFSEKQRVDLSVRIFSVYMFAPYEWHLQKSSSKLQRNILQDTASIVDQIIMPVLTFCLYTFMLFCIIIILVLSTPYSALFSLFIAGIAIISIIKFIQGMLREIGVVIRLESGNQISYIQQGLGAIIDSRITQSEDNFIKKFARTTSTIAKKNRAKGTIYSAAPYYVETVAIIALISVILIFLFLGKSLIDILPTISIVAVSTVRLRQCFNKITGAINTIQVGRASVHQINQDLNELTEVGQCSRVDSSKTVKPFGHLALENITYKYPKTELSALKNISLELNKGSAIGIVGTTGSGKSTLINLILCLLKPQSGRITLNGQNIDDCVGEWYQHIGYIPQTIYLLDDSIRANVAFGLPSEKIDDTLVWEALETANLKQFVEDLPEGLETEVGERGVRLSGGQRQRLGMARALYRNPEILIMDEATSALDNKTEDEVMQAILKMKKNRTLIMIAHRLTTVERCDKIYMLKKGEITFSGKFDEFIKSPQYKADLAPSSQPVLST